jgi:hypothetical protein
MEPMNAAPETSVEVEAARARFEKHHERAVKNFGYGASQEALHIAQGCFERLAAVRWKSRWRSPCRPSVGLRTSMKAR